jgi:hypothetical protein
MHTEALLDAFAIPNLWRPSRLSAPETPQDSLFPNIDFDGKLDLNLHNYLGYLF